MIRIKKFLLKRGVLSLLISLVFAIGVIVSIAVLPKTVEYTIKHNMTETDKKRLKENVTQNISDSNIYTVKLVDGKVCVMNGTEMLHEVRVDYSSLSSNDKERLKEGITVDDKNELLYLTQYLES